MTEPCPKFLQTQLNETAVLVSRARIDTASEPELNDHERAIVALHKQLAAANERIAIHKEFAEEALLEASRMCETSADERDVTAIRKRYHAALAEKPTI